MLLKTSNLILSATLVMALLGSAASAKDGKTIFGDTKKETLKAMALIVKSIGVSKQGKCLYCHIKEGGKPNFPADTQRKEFARLMKNGFVDNLAIKKKVALVLEEEKHKTSIVAEYKEGGEKPGIYLAATVTTSDDKATPKSFETVLALPAKGETVSCMTCHNKVLHFMTHAH